MIVDLTKLFNSNLYKIDVNGKIGVDTSFFKNTDIIRMSTLNVSGFISYDEDLLMLNVNVKGDMTLPCSRTLKEVKVPINIDIEEEIDENNEKVVEIVQNRVDIFPIIWQYILMDIPLRVLAPNAQNSINGGEGWRLIEEEDDKKEEIDPRLMALSKFKE